MSFQERENTSRTENGWPAQDLYHEYLPGDTLLFPLCTFDGQRTTQVETKRVVIEDTKGGGFFGQVLIPVREDFVIKTSLPDPWHHFWRTVNWGFRDIPARDDEIQTQLTHLATKLIHDVLPVISNNRFYSPNSLGYTRLATGFAQVVEKLDGRGPRFDLSTNEYARFRQAQSQLRRIAYGLGLEHVGQIHPDNPFAMANLWFNEGKKQFIWLDTIPAIPHNGWVWPFFNYPFHQDIRDHFAMKEPTFDRIHTDRFRETIKQWERNFSPDQYGKIMANLELYDELQKRYQHTPEEPQYDRAVKELWASLINFCSERSVYKLLAEPAFRNEKRALLRDLYHDPVYRVAWVNTNFILAGIEKAKEAGIIPDDEYRSVQETFVMTEDTAQDTNHRRMVTCSLLFYYFITSQILNLVESSSYLYSLFSEDKLATISFGIFMGWVLPNLLRPAVTVIVGKSAHVDLQEAIKWSAIPKAGHILAVFAQLLADEQRETDQAVWHYTVRSIIAGLSKIRPEGGWGSQLEAELWYKLGTRLEGLLNPSRILIRR